MYEELKSRLEEAAFMLADGTDRKAIHNKIIGCLVLLKAEDTESESGVSPSEAEEVNKVCRRLKMWAKPNRQHQYNSKILNAFLELQREGHKKISEEDINSKLGLNTWFWPNFSQMKVIADRNHGKVFEVSGSSVTVWQPVLSAVKAYESEIFENV